MVSPNYQLNFEVSVVGECMSFETYYMYYVVHVHNCYCIINCSYITSTSSLSSSPVSLLSSAL